MGYIEDNSERLDTAIAYVYCNYKDFRTHSENELFSSIARQLAEQTPQIPPVVTAYRDKWADKRSYPTSDDRVSLTIALAMLFKNTFVLVDALVNFPELTMI